MLKELGREMQFEMPDDLPGRKAVLSLVQAEMLEWKQTGYTFSILLLQVDELSAVRRRHGSELADAVMQSVGSTIRAGLRETDTVGHYGSAEFVVLLPGATRDNAHAAAQRIVDNVRTLRFVAPRADLVVAMNIGVAEVDPTDDSLFTLLMRADTALYVARKHYSRSIVVSDPHDISNRLRGIGRSA